MKTIGMFFMFCLSISFSQNKQLLFGFNDIPQSVLINPSTTLDNKWFMGIPALSHIHIQEGMSGLSPYDLFADDGRDFNAKLKDVVYKLKDNDFFVVNQQVDIFSGGLAYGKGFKKNEYMSFGFYQETDVIAYFPKDYAILAYEGNANNINRVFDLSDLNLRGEVISVFHIGSTKTINKKLTVGVRAKIYSSIFNVSSTNNKGQFITRDAQNQENFYDHIFKLDLHVQTSGLKSLLDDENSEVSSDIKKLRQRLLFGGNLGLGIDLGLTYKFSDQLTFEGSLQDIGFIGHRKDIENYDVVGNYTFEGINPLFPEVPNGQTAADYWNEVADNFEDLFTADTTTTKYTTWRPVKFNSSLTYAFGKQISQNCNCIDQEGDYLNKVGAQLYAVNRPRSPQLALTAFYYRRLFNGLKIKTTYTIDSFSYSNVGFGLSTQLGSVNFYMLADNLFQYKNLAKAQSVSLQLGFNLIFNTNEK